MKNNYSQGIDRSYWQLSNQISNILQKSILILLLLFSVGFANAQTFVVDGLQYTVTSGLEVSVNKDGSCPTGALTIPSLVTDPNTNIEYTVRTIEYQAFFGCSGLTSVTFGDYLNSIEDQAFSQCSGLSSLTLPNYSLTSIGDYAFYQCSELSSLTLPNSLTTIEDFAFYQCSGLTEVTVAWQVPLVINSNVFYGLTLSDITLKVPEGEIATYEATTFWTDFSPIEEDIVCFTIGDLKYCEIDSANVRVTKADACPTGALTIPSLVTDPNTSIEYSVRTIEHQAFESCSGLTSVVLPDSLTSIGFAAFSNCSTLTSLTLPNSLTSIGSFAFRDCSGLTSVSLPNSLTSIGGQSFRGCSGLTSVTLPNSLDTIADYAFANCFGLTEVTVAWQTSLVISSDVFYGLTLSDITLKVPEGTVATYEAATVWTDFSPIVEDIVCFTIGDLKYCEIDSANVRVTKADACPTGALTIPSLVTDPNTIIEYSVRTIETSAFENCTGLTSVTLGDSLTTIGNQAFFECTGLTSVTLGNSLTTIGNAAFRGCSELTSLSLPNSLTSIGNVAFNLCSGLTSVTFGNSLTTIGSDAFSYCSGLTSLALPNSLTTIEGYAFQLCSGLTSVTFGESLTSIGEHAFENCSSLTSVTLGDSLTSIGNRAFFECIGLTSVTFGNSLTTIGVQAFQNCNLTSLDLPNSLTTIGVSAFYQCSSLTSVTLGDSLTSIGNRAFRNCFGLSEVTLAWQTPLVISSDVFDGLTLSDVTLKVPEGEIATYEAAAVWTDFSPISATHNLSQTACASFEFGDSIYTVSGVYNDTITTTENNDSISRLNLTILQIPVTNLNVSACANFTFADSTYTTSGNYSDTLTAMAANGCDSVVSLDLTILEVPDTTQLQESACGSFTFADSTYEASGTYTDVLMAANGCNSVVSLDLTILDISVTNLNVSACESFTFANSTYTTSGNYSDTLTTVNGCDSIVNFALTILQNTSSSVTLSQEGSISWNGVVYNQSIDTTITLVNSVGCDSIVSLSITIIPSDVFFTQVLEICDGETVEVGNSVYSGVGNFVDTLSTQDGCCDSIVTTSIILLSPIATPIVSRPLELTLETTQDYESYQWRRDGAEINGATSYQYNITESGSYQVEVTNDENCSALSAPYNFGTTDISQSLLGRFMVYPNPTSSNATIQVPYGEKFNMEITNVLGEVILKQELVNIETTLETSRLNKGIYFINLYNEKGKQTLRFVKE